tara:strand:+ start:8567 stop:9100 length:534 start_codon:yes stop_codon:yes gene_type:complete
VVAVVANFFPIKGHRYLIRAIPQVVRVYPRVRFVLAGDGESRASAELLAKQLGVADRVTFTGEIRDSLELMKRSDLVVVPSISEGLPITLIEAMALGRAVVATDVGGIPEVVEDGVTARIVPPRNPAALAGAMLELLKAPQRSRRLGEAGQAVARQRFSANRMVGMTEELYLELHGG